MERIKTVKNKTVQMGNEMDVPDDAKAISGAMPSKKRFVSKNKRLGLISITL